MDELFARKRRAKRLMIVGLVLVGIGTLCATLGALGVGAHTMITVTIP